MDKKRAKICFCFSCTFFFVAADGRVGAAGNAIAFADLKIMIARPFLCRTCSVNNFQLPSMSSEIIFRMKETRKFFNFPVRDSVWAQRVTVVVTVETCGCGGLC